jgi:hypothetical protein
VCSINTLANSRKSPAQTPVSSMLRVPPVPRDLNLRPESISMIDSDANSASSHCPALVSQGETAPVITPNSDRSRIFHVVE